MSKSTTAGGCPVAHDFDPFDHHPFEFFATARRERPVFFDEQLHAYVVTRYADVRKVLRDTDNVSAAPALRPNVAPTEEAQKILVDSGFVPAPSIVDEDGGDHRLHRQVTQPPFLPGRVAELEDFIRQQISERLDVVAADGEADMVDAMIYEVPATVILHMMGVPDEQLGMVKDFRGPWAIFLWGFPSDDTQAATAHGMAAFGAWARAVAQRSIDSPGDDIISETVANLKERGALDSSRQWLDSYTLNVVMAGHETTANSAAGGLVALLEHPEQWRALCDDPELIPNAVEEMLRYASGVPTWRQEAVADLEVGGQVIPAGSLIYAAINSANRDEDVFEDGDRFDICRSNAKSHLTFGFGAHTCMGNNLARVELRIMLEELTRRFPDLALVPDQDFTFSPNTSQRGPEHVQVRWTNATASTPA